MVKVCQDRFPQTQGYYLNDYLKSQLDIYVDGIKNDFDFVFLITAGGMVRLGKSVMGMQIGDYVNDEVNKRYGLNNTFDLKNYCFKGDELIKVAKTLPKYSVIVYDEAGSDLVGRKTMHSTTQALLDFFRECGQLNLFLICILPDFFELPRSIAITRSACLIDVDFRERFNRGLFRFYSPRAKKRLYILGKKMLDYTASKCDFVGNFTNFYPLDEQGYRNLKHIALTGRQQDEAEKVTRKDIRITNQRNILIRWLHEELGYPLTAIAERIGIEPNAISMALAPKLYGGLNAHG